jgi:predicted ribonuclease toxin of YeeF-YezG toxin-antitoxin module
VKELPQMAEKVSEKIKKVKSVVELVGKYDWNNVKRYFQHIQEVTGRTVLQKQVDKLKDALRAKEYTKLDRDVYKKHAALFTQEKRLELIKEWEVNTNQKWPTYTEPYYTKSGNIYKQIGDPYDAHHIIEQNFGGEHEWWNMHPAKFPDEHQGGIHGAGSPARELFK